MNNEFENYESENPIKEKSFGHRLLSVSVKCVLLGGVLGAVIGFAIPFTTGYLIPKLETAQNSDVVVDEATAEETENFNRYVSELAALDEASANTVALVKKVNPSIVCITSITETQNWFNQTFESTGSGSGIIFSQDESNVYIVTNAHVISGANSVSISVEGSDLVSASLVGKDTNADLAVISVSWTDLKAAGVNSVTLAEFGSSSDLQVGESVIAIGNALGSGSNTATAGIVSALAKDVNIQGKKLTVIQTDAAINPGNSGGALINSSGQVIGINTAKLALTSIEGIGYSIASDVAMPIIEQLMGTTDTPALGVYITTVSESMAEQYGLTQGVLVQALIDGGSASYADIQANDIITSFNGQPVFTADQLTTALKECSVGDQVVIVLVRDGETITVTV